MRQHDGRPFLQGKRFRAAGRSGRERFRIGENDGRNLSNAAERPFPEVGKGLQGGEAAARKFRAEDRLGSVAGSVVRLSAVAATIALEA